MEIQNNLDIDKIRDSIQSGNVSFLIGSGMSRPYLDTLENIERDLTATEENVSSEYHRNILLVRDYVKYMNAAMFGNIQLIDTKLNQQGEAVLRNYRAFISSVNQILQKRSNSLLDRQTNIFTTNIDLFFESALEAEQAEYSDGFHGRFIPRFDTSNFRKSYFKQSLHYDHKSELPVFNLLKMHGSLSWNLADSDLSEIGFSKTLSCVRSLQELGDPSTAYVSDEFKEEVTSGNYGAERAVPVEILEFLKLYKRLQIVNPTKNKFGTTVLNRTYYDLLRVYSNSLEKENTILFVMGFSFADEHIRDLTIRAANSNPTLAIYVMAHTNSSASEIDRQLSKHNSTNKNIAIVAPELGDDHEDLYKYDLETINSNIFDKLIEMISGKDTDTHSSRGGE